MFKMFNDKTAKRYRKNDAVASLILFYRVFEFILHYARSYNLCSLTCLIPIIFLSFSIFYTLV